MMKEEVDEDCVLASTDSANTALNSLPVKSKKLYRRTYEEFAKYCETNNVINFTEQDMLGYLVEKSKCLKPPSLWAQYSMLKTTVAIKDRIDMSKYTKVLAFLKNQAKGYKPAHSKVLTKEQIYKFLLEAPNDTYLMAKVLLIVGVTGALMLDELAQLTTNDLHDLGSAILVITKKSNKVFSILNIDENGIDFLKLCRKYLAIREHIKNHTRLFVSFKNNKCYPQPLGKNMYGLISKRIAGFLKLPDASSYTANCFKSSSLNFFKGRISKKSIGVGSNLSDILANNRKLLDDHSNESEQALMFDTSEEMETSEDCFNVGIKEEVDVNDDFNEYSNLRSEDEEEQDPLLASDNEQSLHELINPTVVEETLKNDKTSIITEDLVFINNSDTKMIIFSSRTNLNALCDMSKISIDKSSSSSSSEIITFNGIENNHHTALLYSLLQTKEENSYYLLLKKISEISLNYSKILEPKEIKLDCDKNLVEAVLKVWPKVTILISPLHIHQMWLQKIKEFNLEEEYNDDSVIGEWLQKTFKLTRITVKEFTNEFVEELKFSMPKDERVVKYADYLLKTFVNENADFPPNVWAKK